MFRFLIPVGLSLFISLSVAHGSPDIFGVQPGMSQEAAIAALKRFSRSALVEVDKSGIITAHNARHNTVALTLGSMNGKTMIIDVIAQMEAYLATSVVIAELREKYGNETLAVDTNQDSAGDAVDSEDPHDTLVWLYDVNGRLVRWAAASTCFKRVATAIAEHGTVASSRECAFRFLVMARLKYEIHPRHGTINPHSIGKIVQELHDLNLMAATPKIGAPDPHPLHQFDDHSGTGAANDDESPACKCGSAGDRCGNRICHGTQAHQIQRATPVPATFDATWSALIDLFAQRAWTISTADKRAGLIATGWLAVPDPYANCGSAPLAVSHASSMQLNVRVRPGNATSSIEVNVLFRQLRSYGLVTKLVQCTSNGMLESEILSEVAERVTPRPVESHTVQGAPPTPASDRQAHDARGFYCTTSGLLSECMRDKDTCDKARRDDFYNMPPMPPCHHVDSVFCVCGNESDDPEDACAENACAETHDTCNEILDLNMFGAVAVDRSTIGYCVERK